MNDVSETHSKLGMLFSKDLLIRVVLTASENMDSAHMCLVVTISKSN